MDHHCANGRAGMILGDYIYIFGSCCDEARYVMASVERYTIVGNTWDDLPEMDLEHCGHCVVDALKEDIYMLGYLPGLECLILHP